MNRQSICESHRQISSFLSGLKYSHQVSQMRILASTNLPFRLTTVQIPNLALHETKRITVYEQTFAHFFIYKETFPPVALCTRSLLNFTYSQEKFTPICFISASSI